MNDETGTSYDRTRATDVTQSGIRDTPVDDYTISVFDNLKVPLIFRMWLILLSSMGALVVFGMAVFGIVKPDMIGFDIAEFIEKHAADDASTFLHTNIEILVTIFAVTLGVTLLGLQFRAQSYSIQAMIKYIRNKVVHGLIAIFISLIGMNMALVFMFDTMQEFEADYGGQIMAMMMGTTIFSLYYLAGYVFYMVEGTQLRRVLEVISEDMDDTRPDRLEGKHQDEELEPFQIWEQVVLKAVADDNTYAFRQSVNVMSGLYDKLLRKDDTRILDKTNGFLKTTMLRCAKADRSQLAKYFLRKFEDKARIAAGESATRRKTGTNIIDIWIQMMREAIIYDNDKIVDHCAMYIRDAMQDNIKICRDDNEMNKVTDFFHAQFASLVGFAVSNNHHAYTRRYLDFVFDKFEPIAGYRKLYIYAVGNWETIMSHSIDVRNYKVFEIGMTRMAYYVDHVMGMEGVDRGLVLDVSNRTILRLAERLCAKWDRRYVEAFLRKYPSWRNDGKDRPDRAWMRVMVESIRRGDTRAFYYGLGRIEGYADEERDLGSVDNFYPISSKYENNSSRYEDSENLGIIEDGKPTKSGIVDDGVLEDLRGKDFRDRLVQYSLGITDEYRPLIDEFKKKVEGFLELDDED